MVKSPANSGRGAVPRGEDSAIEEAAFFWIMGPVRTPLFIICAAIFANMFLYGLFIGLAPLYLYTLDLSEFELGSLFSAFAAITLVAVPILSVFMRELPYKACFVFGGILCSVSSLVLALAHNSLTNVLLSRLVHGLGATVVWLAGPVVVCDLFGVASRTKAMGIVYIYATTAFLVGAVLGANSFEWTGSSFPILIATTVLNVCTTSLLVSSLPSDGSYGIEGETSLEDIAAQKELEKNDDHVMEEGKAGFLMLLRDRTVVLVLISVFLYSIANIIVQAFVPSWVKAFLKTSVSGAADIYAIMATTKIISQPFFGRMTQRYGPNVVSGIGMILHGITLPLLPLSDNLVPIVIAFSVLGCAMTATILPTFISLSNQVERLQRLHNIKGIAATRLYVLANALWLTAFMCGSVITPMVTGHLLDTWTYTPWAMQYNHVLVLGCVGGVMALIHAPIYIFYTRGQDLEHVESSKGYMQV